MTFDQILNDLRNKVYHPVYFLMGEEPYYIDEISDLIEDHVLNDMEKEFNQSILYGKDVDVATILSYAKRYPMMSNYQVVIIKEAQSIKDLIRKEDKEDVKDPFLTYLENPLPSTILVFCHKYKSLDKRSKVYKVISKKAVVFDSKKIYDDKVSGWITAFAKTKGYPVNPAAAQVLADHLGNDLSRVANEMKKLFLNVKKGEEINVKHVEENVGISKDFNVFEFNNAVAKKDILRANRIAEYFGSNPKSNPAIVVLASLFGFFSKLMMYHGLKDKSQSSVASGLGINPFFVKEYTAAARLYSADKTIRIISLLREYDAKLKGVDSVNADDGELLRELTWKIIH